MLARLWLRTDERPTPAAQLATARTELSAALRKVASLDGQLQHWIDQAIRARKERDRAEADRDHAQARLVEAMAEKREAGARIFFLEEELRTAGQIENHLVAAAEALRHELRELRAGLAVGALRKGRR